jgi:hypothetical protein
VEEIVSSGPDRIIVYEGAEEKLKQLGTGLLEKLGIGGPSWEQEERERFRTGMVPVENQLAAGQASVQEQRRIQPATSRAFEPEAELEYVELEERRQQEPLRQRRYLDDEPEERSREIRYPEGRFQQDRFREDHDPEGRYQNERYQNEPYQNERSSQERFPENRFSEDRYPQDRSTEVRPSQDRYADQRQPAEPRRVPAPQPEPRRETSREPKREPMDVEAEDLGDPW